MSHDNQPLNEDQFLNWRGNIHAILFDSRVCLQNMARMLDNRRDTRVFFRVGGEGYAGGGFAGTFWEQQQFILYTQLDKLFDGGASAQHLSFYKLFKALRDSKSEAWLLGKLASNLDHAGRGEVKGLGEGKFTGDWMVWEDVEDFMRTAHMDMKPHQALINTIEHHRNTATAHSALMHEITARPKMKNVPMVRPDVGSMTALVDLGYRIYKELNYGMGYQHLMLDTSGFTVDIVIREKYALHLLRKAQKKGSPRTDSGQRAL